MKTILAVPLLLLVPFCRAAGAAEKFDISGYTIVSRTDPGLSSGVVKTWSVFFASKKDEEMIAFYIVYFGKTQSLPQVGQVCDITAEWGRIDELVGDGDPEVKRGRIVERHHCRWPEAAEQAGQPTN